MNGVRGEKENMVKDVVMNGVKVEKLEIWKIAKVTKEC